MSLEGHSCMFWEIQNIWVSNFKVLQYIGLYIYFSFWCRSFVPRETLVYLLSDAYTFSEIHLHVPWRILMYHPKGTGHLSVELHGTSICESLHFISSLDRDHLPIYKEILLWPLSNTLMSFEGHWYVPWGTLACSLRDTDMSSKKHITLS